MEKEGGSFLNIPFEPNVLANNFITKPIDSKFKGEQDPRHGGQLQWPGVDGLPFRGPPVTLKNEELSNIILVHDFKAHVFDLTKNEDYEYYCWVMDRICNGFFRCIHINRTWSAEKNTMIIYVEWVQSYYELPKSVT